MSNFWRDLIINILVSSITGVGASFAIWWLTFKYWSPKITFAPAISRLKTDENPSGYKYRYKFENSGSRNIIDVEAIVRVRIKGLRPNFPKNWEVIYLPTSSLDYKKIAIVRPAGGKQVRPVFEIKAYECDYFKKSFFTDETRIQAATQKLTLDDIMNLGTDANLQILLLGYDQFSGARKFFESEIMTGEQIISGSYFRKSVQIDQSSQEEGEDFA